MPPEDRLFSAAFFFLLPFPLLPWPRKMVLTLTLGVEQRGHPEHEDHQLSRLFSAHEPLLLLKQTIFNTQLKSNLFSGGRDFPFSGRQMRHQVCLTSQHMHRAAANTPSESSCRAMNLHEPSLPALAALQCPLSCFHSTKM